VDGLMPISFGRDGVRVACEGLVPTLLLVPQPTTTRPPEASTSPWTSRRSTQSASTVRKS